MLPITKLANILTIQKLNKLWNLEKERVRERVSEWVRERVRERELDKWRERVRERKKERERESFWNLEQIRDENWSTFAYILQTKKRIVRLQQQFIFNLLKGLMDWFDTKIGRPKVQHKEHRGRKTLLQNTKLHFFFFSSFFRYFFLSVFTFSLSYCFITTFCVSYSLFVELLCLFEYRCKYNSIFVFTLLFCLSFCLFLKTLKKNILTLARTFLK